MKEGAVLRCRVGEVAIREVFTSLTGMLVHIMVASFLTCLPANADWEAVVCGLLPPMGESWVKFLAVGFGLAYAWLLEMFWK